MQIVFLTHYAEPEIGAAQIRIGALTRGLQARGHCVTIHTGFPHYPTGTVQPPYRVRPWKREHHDGLRVVRSAVYPAPNRGFVRRLADHLSFAASALATAHAAGAADVVVVESPPLFTAAAGVLYARLKRAPLVVNVADRWPATAVELGALANSLAISAAEALERWCYRHAAVVTTPTAGIAAALEGVPDAAGKVRRMLPAVDLQRFSAAPPPPLDGPLRVVYAGTIGLAQNLTTLVEAARIAGPEVVSLTIAGGGVEAEEVAERAAAVDNVRWLGTVPSTAVPGLYADAHAGAVVLGAQRVLDGAFPTKLLEVMAAGRPVVLSARGESAREVEEAGAGIVAVPEDPVALADALRRLRGDPAALVRMANAARARVENRYGRARSVEHWCELLTCVAG